MIDPHAIVTYAQYDEDIILRALLHEVDKGFYVDVGANHPTTDSVTKFFYDRGWRGISIEPIKGLHRQLTKERPEDTNLQCGAGDEEGVATLREYRAQSGHSTLDDAQKRQHPKGQYTDYEVTVKSLEQIFDEQKPPHVHFLKIDVEGFEYQVVKGNDWRKYRPEIVCIETNHMSQDWRPLMKKAEYRLFISDGLNEYYVAAESWSRTEDFAERAVKLDYHALKQHQYQSWSDDSRQLKEYTKTIKDQDGMIRALRRENDHLRILQTLTLKDVPYRSRVKRSLYGLTVDWVRFKKSNRKD